jgi:hypothetical protein
MADMTLELMLELEDRVLDLGCDGWRREVPACCRPTCLLPWRQTLPGCLLRARLRARAQQPLLPTEPTS